jgi:outer membrane protein OmpA-like peptidoglycan-associated protein
MNVRTIVILAVTIGWFWFCQHAYVCWIKQACVDKTEQIADPSDGAPALPLGFRYQQAEPEIHPEAFPDYRQKKLVGMKDKNFLIIEGQYYEGEADSLGLARANAVRALFLPDVPEDRIFLQSMKSSSQVDQSAPFEAAQIFWNDKKPQTAIAATEGQETPEAAEETQDTAAAEATDGQAEEPKEEEARIVSLPDRILIYHKFGSAERTVDPQVDEYLDLLAQRLAQTNESVQLTGHTDDIGTTENNQKLGTQRAQYIKSILIDKGVDANRIKTRSLGESKPIEDNATDAGRKKNRRTELLLKRN